jgi:transposase
VRLGVDEIRHAHGHQFLTCVADHDTGRVVWAQAGRCAASLQAFFEALSDEQKASIEVISMDMSARL